MNESFASMVTTRSVVVLLARAGRWRAHHRRPSVRPSVRPSSSRQRWNRARTGLDRTMRTNGPHNTHRRVRTTNDRRRSPTRGWIGRSTNLSSSVDADRGGGLDRAGVVDGGDGGQKRKEGIWTVNRRAERERTDAVPTTDGDDEGRRRRRRRRGVTDPRDGRRRSGFDARRGRR